MTSYLSTPFRLKKTASLSIPAEPGFSHKTVEPLEQADLELGVFSSSHFRVDECKCPEHTCVCSVQVHLCMDIDIKERLQKDSPDAVRQLCTLLQDGYRNTTADIQRLIYHHVNDLVLISKELGRVESEMNTAKRLLREIESVGRLTCSMDATSDFYGTPPPSSDEPRDREGSLFQESYSMSTSSGSMESSSEELQRAKLIKLANEVEGLQVGPSTFLLRARLLSSPCVLGTSRYT